MGVQVGTLSRSRVSESSVCPSARLCEGIIAVEASSSMGLDERIKFKYDGGGKPVKVSLFNEAMALHEAGVDGVVHKVVGMYHARWMVRSTGGVFTTRFLAWLDSPDHF